MILRLLRETIFEIRIFIGIGPFSFYSLNINEKRFFEITFFMPKDHLLPENQIFCLKFPNV